MDISEIVEDQEPKDIMRLAGGLALITLGAGHDSLVSQNPQAASLGRRSGGERQRRQNPRRRQRHAARFRTLSENQIDVALAPFSSFVIL